MPDRSAWIEPLDLFGMGRMWFDGRPGRECLQDQARYDAFDRSIAAIEIAAPGCRHSRLSIDVAQDAIGRWWSGFAWSCPAVPDNFSCGVHTPIDTYRGATRDAAVLRAIAGILESLPPVPTGRAARIMATWRGELCRRAGALINA